MNRKKKLTSAHGTFMTMIMPTEFSCRPLAIIPYSCLASVGYTAGHCRGQWALSGDKVVHVVRDKKYG